MLQKIYADLKTAATARAGWRFAATLNFHKEGTAVATKETFKFKKTTNLSRWMRRVK